MPSQFVQIIGEERFYKQAIVNDTITSADWGADGTGITLSTQQRTATDTSVLVNATQTGDYILTCVIVTTGGQTLIGETRIRVVETIV